MGIGPSLIVTIHQMQVCGAMIYACSSEPTVASLEILFFVQLQIGAKCPSVQNVMVHSETCHSHPSAEHMRRSTG